MSAKALLITGIGGFIGSHLMEHILINTDWNIVGLDSFRHKGLTDRVTDPIVFQQNIERVKIITHDLTAPISPLMRDSIGPVDYIINMASESHVDRSIEHPVPFIQNNVALVLNMLEYARIVKPRTFIPISTDEVYGPMNKGDPHPEWDTILPSNPYSASKAAQEAIAISYWRTYSVPVIITNCFDKSVRVFSEKGFVGYEEISIGDRVWSLDSTGAMVLTPVLDKIKMKNQYGKLIEIKTEKTNQLVTPNHRIYAQKRNGNGSYGELKVIKAQQLLNHKGRYRIPTNGTWTGFMAKVSDETLQLAGWYVSEGYGLPGNGIAFGAGSKEQQNEIIHLLQEYGNGQINGRSVRIYSQNLKNILNENDFGKHAKNKHVPKWIKNLCVEKLRLFFEAAIDGDGSRYPMALVYYTKSYDLATDMCEIGMKLGYAVRISKRKTYNPSKTKLSESFIVRFRYSNATIEKQNIKEVESDDDVWCIKTSIGNVFIERDGIVSLSGQTMNNYGERQDPEKYLPKVIRSVLTGERVTVHGTPTDIGSRFWLHARNHADALLWLLNKIGDIPKMFPDFHRPDRFNVVGDKQIDNLELAQLVASVIGKPLKYVLEDFHSTRPGHDPHYGLTGDLLELYGWKPPIDLESSLAKTIKWYEANPRWLKL